MSDAFIFDSIRTPRGKGRANGGLHEVPPIELATQVLIALRDRNHLPTEDVEDVIFGVVAAHGEQGCGVPRVAALNAGFSENVAGLQLSRFCSSGLEAVNTAAARIMAGQASLLIAGGVESMSRVAMGSDGGAWANDPAITYRTYLVPQGIGADLIATLNGYSRADIDAYAMASQQRAARAWKEGRFAHSIIPVVDDLGQILLDHDETVRGSTNMEDLAKLEPAFAGRGEKIGYDAVAIQKYPEVEAIDHVHTAGSSSAIVDGAAGLLIADRPTGEALGLKPRAKIRSFASVGSEPTIMLTGPSPASLKALKLAGLQIRDIDLFEVNEAFASVPMYFMDQMKIPHDRVNVNGGAIAMGHPTGATGAMILGTVLDELERSDKTFALATLCVGVGMGTATIIERV
jgi:acetyl-CoA C-acetyltransferase